MVAEVLPGDKEAHVERLQAEGRGRDGRRRHQRRARAGPGGLGVAIGTGTDVAIEASDVTLVGGDPRLVLSAIALSRATMRVIRQNLFWAFAYNVVLIPVAMGVLYPSSASLLDPALAAGAMALSSVSVVTELAAPARVDVRPGQSGSFAGVPSASSGTARSSWSSRSIGLGLAGGVLAADRAIDAALPQLRGQGDQGRPLRASRRDRHRRPVETICWCSRTTIRSVHDWMVEGVPTWRSIARPGETGSACGSSSTRPAST